MAKPTGNDPKADHKLRMEKKRAARRTHLDVPTQAGLLARYRRLNVLSRRAIQVTAGITVTGAVLIGMHLLESKGRYCFVPVGVAPTDTYLGATLSMGDARDIDFSIVARKLSGSLNDALEKAIRLDTYVVQDTKTGAVVGAVMGPDYEPLDATSPQARVIPNQGFMRLDIMGKEYKVPVGARFTVSENLRTIKIGPYEFDAANIISNEHMPDEPKGSFGTMFVRPVFIYKTRGTPECKK